MNPLTPYLAWLRIGLVAVVLAGAAAWHAHAVSSAHHAGVVQESERRDAIDARNTAAANTALHEANEHVRALQATLADLQARLSHLSQENENAKIADARRHADLLAGRDRMRVDVQPAARDLAQAGSAAGAAAAGVDPEPAAQYDLSPAAAAGLDAIRGEHNEAVRRLGACIEAYDKVKAAVDAL